MVSCTSCAHLHTPADVPVSCPCSGLFRTHRVRQFISGSLACHKCVKHVATVECTICGDSLCEECRAATHVKGRRRQHPFKELAVGIDKDIGAHRAGDML